MILQSNWEDVTPFGNPLSGVFWSKFCKGNRTFGVVTIMEFNGFVVVSTKNCLIN